MPLVLIEFPADDPARARQFWSGLLGIELDARSAEQGEGWQSSGTPTLGIHARGTGPGDTRDLSAAQRHPYQRSWNECALTPVVEWGAEARVLRCVDRDQNTSCHILMLTRKAYRQNVQRF